jgi:hypothetical protein
MPNNPYIDLYVSRKKVLFPLIEKYSGLSMKGKSHGEAAALYIWLLRNNEGFVRETEALAGQKYSNAIGDWRIWNIFRSEENKIPKSSPELEPGYQPEGYTPPAYSIKAPTVSGPIATIVSTIGNVFSSITDYRTAKENQDTVLYQAVLDSQGKSDTGKILIISGVVLAFIGLGVFMVVKMKK